MDTSAILKQARDLATDEEKLMLLAGFIGENMDNLEPKDFILLLTPGRQHLFCLKLKSFFVYSPIQKKMQNGSITLTVR